MHDDVIHSHISSHARDGHRMTIGGMHATGADEADEMQPDARRSSGLHGLEQRRVAREGSALDLRVDARQILQDRTSRAKVEVADLTVAHLTDRKPNGLFARCQLRVRPSLLQLMPSRHRGTGDGITVWVRADAEPIDDHEHDWPRPLQRRLLGLGGTQAPDVASLRAAAVKPARATMPDISSTFRLAPPTSAPSIDASARNSSMEVLVTEPP